MRRLAAAVLFWMLLLSFPAGAEIYEETGGSSADFLEDQIPGLGQELAGLEEFLEDGTGVSFSDLMDTLRQGGGKECLQAAGAMLQEAFFSQIQGSGGLLFQAVAAGIMGAVFSQAASVFQGGQVAEAGFYGTYLFLFTCLTASFFGSLRIAARVLEQLLEFMRLLMPAYFLASAFSGGSVSALAFYETMMAAVTGVQWLCSRALLPAVRIYVLLVLGSHAVKEPFLTRLTDLTEKAVSWSLKTLLGLVTGFQVIQSMILPFADHVKQAGMRRLIQAIPGVGPGAGAAVEMVLGSAVLIKNSLGAAGCAALCFLALGPVVQLVVLMLLYQAAAVMMEPVCDRRMVSCVEGISRGHRLLLQILLYSLTLFLVAIALTCMTV